MKTLARLASAGRGGIPLLATAVVLAAAGPPGPARAAASAAAAQDPNILWPVSRVEERLKLHPFEVEDFQDTRFEGDRTQRALLRFPDSTRVLVKWAKSARGGEEFNNQPRYEVAAYRFQTLFLEEHEYVVPPTVARCFPLGWYRTLDPDARATFPGTESVLVVLQYWLWNVTAEDAFDEDRFVSDTAYARHLANLNVFTHLARHNDANFGNVLVSSDSTSPRVFSVDNGLTFGRETSNRGHFWRRLRVDRIPASTVRRLRQLDRERLHRELGVLAEFREQGGQLVRVEPSENLKPGEGIRRRDGVVQLGLTDDEIDRVWWRLESLLNDVDDGDLATF